MITLHEFSSGFGPWMVAFRKARRIQKAKIQEPVKESVTDSYHFTMLTNNRDNQENNLESLAPFQIGHFETVGVDRIQNRNSSSRPFKVPTGK